MENCSSERWIHILSLDENAGYTLIDILKNLFEDSVRVTYQSVLGKNHLKGQINPPIVLTSGEFLVPKAHELYPEATIVAGRRQISYKNLDKLLEIPDGQKVLVVNHPLEASLTTIKSLQSLGFNHVNYVPFEVGMPIESNVTVAISPNMMHICPEFITKRVDIGSRSLSFSTITTLINLMRLPNQYIDKFFYQHNKHFVQTAYQLNDERERAVNKQQTLDAILGVIDEGVIFVDHSERIIYGNRKFYQMFPALGLYDEHIKLEEFFKQFNCYPDLKNKGFSGEREVYFSNDRGVYISSVSLSPTDKDDIIIITPIDDIRGKEASIRRELSDGYIARYTFDSLVGSSPSFKSAKSKAKVISNTPYSVLIVGESGTGKELFAQAIHNHSGRKGSPFVPVNLASLPQSIVESELFGYDEGAFTGARKRGKMGLFEKAHNGTIFIDEIGDASLSTQVSLLRVLQEKEVMRLGGSEIVSVDVRVVAATNKNLNKLIEKGEFREDLYYRLNVLPITIPPLRERVEDIPLLLTYFMRRKGKKLKISKEAMSALLQYRWPGNIRELENMINYLCVVEQNSSITLDMLPENIIRNINYIPDHILDDTNILSDDEKETLLILQKEGKAMGRKKISIALEKRGYYYITESRVRSILDNLAKNKFVEIGKTRQGTRLTELGKKWTQKA